MPKTKISEFDVDPANNTDINSINIAEGCAPSGINNAIRQLMSDLKEFQTGAGGDPFNGAVNGTVGATTPAAGTFTTVTANTSVSTDTISEKTSATGVTVDGVLLKDNAVSASGGFTQSSTFNSASTMGFKNRIINGAVMIDQRNAGASVTVTTSTGYTLDRWTTAVDASSKFSVQQVSDAPTGFKNSLKATSLSAYTPSSSEEFRVGTIVEGYNWSDMGYGASGASTAVLKFSVKSSLTGTFGVYIANSDNSRTFVSTYVVNAANTWEEKTVTITGDTTGTWLSTNGRGIQVFFVLAAGSNYYTATTNTWASSSGVRTTSGQTQFVSTNAATWQITGVQLEKGSTATSFDYRPYGTELQLCQRYCIRWCGNYAYESIGGGSFNSYSSTNAQGQISTIVPMRTQPSLTWSTLSFTDVVAINNPLSNLYIDTSRSGNNSINMTVVSTSMTSGRTGYLYANNSTSAYLIASAEL